MPRLLETIHILEGKALHLPYHQKRLDASRKCLGFHSALHLKLSPPKEGEYKCRIVYEKEIESIEYLPYHKKEIRSFKLLNSDIVYDLKYENRDEINALLQHKSSADEIIIVKNGLVTDTSIANLAFFDGENWLTPRAPLLKGTARQRLLDEHKIRCVDIAFTQIKNYKKIALMNAMVGFCVIENAIIS
jgi:4-amino-4-deoxychorismate lyase